MKAIVLTLGCPENCLDAKRIELTFKENGFEIVKDVRDADSIVFNSCALTQGTEEASLKIIKKINSIKRNNAHFIVSGCLPKIDKEALLKVHKGDIVFNDGLERLKAACGIDRVYEGSVNEYLLPVRSLERNREIILSLKRNGLFLSLIKLWEIFKAGVICNIEYEHYRNAFPIRISTGCLGNCKYCAVRISRGNLRSRPINEIKEELKKGYAAGFSEFILIGTDVGAYGIDLGVNLVELLEEITKEQGDYKIGIRNLNPKYLIELFDGFKIILGSGKIFLLCSSVESGSNKVLQNMNRRYTVEQFRGAVDQIHNEFPDVSLGTQVMVGFPGETKEDFKKTLALFSDLNFSFVEVYMYQSRPGTKSALMGEQIAWNVKKRRYLIALLKLFILHIRKRLKTPHVA